MRKQARDWLRLDLAAWAKKVDTGTAADRIQAQKTFARLAGRPRPGRAPRPGHPAVAFGRTAGLPGAVARGCSPAPPCANRPSEHQASVKHTVDELFPSRPRLALPFASTHRRRFFRLTVSITHSQLFSGGGKRSTRSPPASGGRSDSDCRAWSPPRWVESRPVRDPGVRPIPYPGTRVIPGRGPLPLRVSWR